MPKTNLVLFRFREKHAIGRLITNARIDPAHNGAQIEKQAEGASAGLTN
jgi:hypothetical protein